ncbi:MAG TPA: hypothetical protein VJN18_05535 [Polyangiaceae bacterium]|nr:hypothetical protein [Polyangiaceae bacterium]
MLIAKPMRHFPACCSDCRRLWLVSTMQAPSASPVCPHCGERGRLVPGAYYSDPGATIFERLEAAVQASQLSPTALLELGNELERILPSPIDPAIDAAFTVSMSRLGLSGSIDEKAVGKRVVLRMLVMIASTLSRPVVRESGVMRLPQTIAGLFDLVPKKRSPTEPDAKTQVEQDVASGADEDGE